MLNEIMEVRGYLYDFNSEDQQYKRIKANRFCHAKGLNGLERAMTMIARFFLFEDGVDGEQAIIRARLALEMWCGLAFEEYDEEMGEEHDYLKEHYPLINGWLPNYLKSEVISLTGASKEEVAKSIKKMYANRKKYRFQSFNRMARISGGNTFKQITYEKAIANAIVAGGPLKRYYMVCKDEEWLGKIKRISSGNKIKKPAPGDCDRIPKLMAAYLLERNRKLRTDDSPRFESINYSTITHWTKGSTQLYSSHFNVLLFNEEKLFQFNEGKSGNLSKIKPNPDWFRSCGWDLIEATDNDDALDEYLADNPNAIFYSDAGGFMLLRKNVRYIR